MDARSRSREWYRGKLTCGRAPVTGTYPVVADAVCPSPQNTDSETDGPHGRERSHAQHAIWSQRLQFELPQYRSHGENELNRDETAPETPVVASPEGGVGAALPVFSASRREAVDIEALRVGEVFLEHVTDRRTDHDLGARGNPAPREVERVGGRPQHSGRDRMEP